ncbi:MAG: DUF5125 domain-containing protein [Bacteroidetes bacterium]|uniref:DUF5125 domain-containing protein n=1 Tax=Candidatus Cryptobacteroides faecipullorum TaxID=2840764 RepID=A0A9D9I6Z9_9BACT|nr:DUF5125 domain-containing protein [Candidatus Cryptobacteroides faecipullorum]
MKNIVKATIALTAAASVFMSCKKEFEYVFADKGPNLSVASYSESADMGGRLTFSVDVSDSDFALSTVKAKLCFDQDVVSDTTIRTKEAGIYDGWLDVPFMKDIPNGNAALVFEAQNVGQAITRDTVYVAVSRPEFEYLTLVTADGRQYRMEPAGEKYVYAVEGDFPPQCSASIESAPVPGTQNVLHFGWESGAVELDAEGMIPFSYSSTGYTITFNTLTFEASPFEIPQEAISINGQEMEMVSAGNYSVTLDLKQNSSLSVSGIELTELLSYYLDPDYLTIGTTGAAFNAVSGHYRIDLNTAAKTVRFTRVKEDRTDATLAEGALWLMGWGVASPVMTNQFGWDSGNNYCMAEVRPMVFQFTGKAVAETDGTTQGGRFRYDYVSCKYFFFNGYNHGEANADQIEISGNAGDLIKLSESNIELASNLEEGAAYRLTIDLSEGTFDGTTYTGPEKVIFDKL